MRRLNPFKKIINFKRSFTLLELFIGFSILLLVGSTSVFWIYQKVQADRFFSQVQRLEKSIHLCKKMALIREENISFSLFQDNNEIQYELVSKTPLLLSKNNRIENGYFLFQKKNTSNLVIEFQPNGTSYPKGALWIHSVKKKFKKEIFF